MRSHENENEDKQKVLCKSKVARGTLLFHHVFDFSRPVMWKLQVEDPLHEHLSIAVEIQGVWVADDLIVRVRVQQHRHVAASGPHLNITEADVKIACGVLSIYVCAEHLFWHTYKMLRCFKFCILRILYASDNFWITGI